MMSKVAVVYWSGTGNTEQMAQQVAEGAKQAGAQAVLLTAAEFGADQIAERKLLKCLINTIIANVGNWKLKK